MSLGVTLSLISLVLVIGALVIGRRAPERLRALYSATALSLACSLFALWLSK
jgi:hypothetical protein